MNRSTLWPVFAVLVLCSCGSGCRRPAERAAEKAVAELLPTYLGPAAKYGVKVEADSLGALVRGRVRGVRIEGTEVRIVPDLTVGELRIDAEEVEVRRDRKSLRSVGKARFRCRIDGLEIARAVRTRSSPEEAPDVRVVGSVMHVRVVPRLMGVPTLPVDVEGRLEVSAGGSTMHFVPDSARLSIVPVPKAVLGFVSERVNPVVDLRKANVPVVVETALLRDGALHLRGTIPPEEIVRRSEGITTSE
ncbi:MAG: DUF2993 domain-containing protein [Armatimonadota bacterium]